MSTSPVQQHDSTPDNYHLTAMRLKVNVLPQLHSLRGVMSAEAGILDGIGFPVGGDFAKRIADHLGKCYNAVEDLTVACEAASILGATSQKENTDAGSEANSGRP
jgi:hypothetical protein